MSALLVDMMKKTADAVAEESKKLKIARPKVIAVTILTSMDENNLKKVGISDIMEIQVLRLANVGSRVLRFQSAISNLWPRAA